MPSADEIKNARQLMATSIQAVRKRDYGAAERAALAFLAAGFDHFKVRRVLGVVFEKKGETTKAEMHMHRALEHQPGDGDSWFHLNRIKIQLGELENAKSYLKNYKADFSDLFNRKLNFYKLNIIFRYVEEQYGAAAAVEWSLSALDLPETSAAVLASIKARGAALTLHARPLVGDAGLVRALDALDAGHPADAVRATMVFLNNPSRDHSELDRLVVEGPDAGHPIWHVINPYFHLWAAAACEENASQSRWQNTEAIGKNWTWSEVEADYRGWCVGLEAELAREMIGHVTADGVRPPKILDLGCGTGVWLRFLAEFCAVPVECLGGVELHEARAACARAGLLDFLGPGVDQQSVAEVVAANVVAGDLLNLDVEALKAKHAPIDLVTMLVVSGCFNDGELTALLRSIAALSPRHLMTTSVTKRWDFWHGREDEDEYYARAGYRLTQRKWNPERLSDRQSWQAVAPLPYWTNRSISVFARD
ncbi:MAG: class I SAM-dependent methyltransferase [Proteobacteria bacterium]|nr:class I SAM-dependent methyltransferase [Pseudomonadota bacterium]